MTALHFRTATDLLRALRARELSAGELLEHFAERCARRDPPLNSVVAKNLEAARARAREADAAISHAHRLGALHGLPMTVKDAIEVVGMPTACGAPELAKHFAPRNAHSVQRLVDAGAVIFGKTNSPLYAGDLQTYNEVYGTTNNPWDVTRGPGGSSGGAAAALAAGMTPLELGSDIGGSIRNPAHFCGVYGHKPSYGIVSGIGHIPGPPGMLAPTDLNVIGPMARAPEDLELALAVLAAPRAEDAAAWRVELPAPRRKRIGDFRVAVWIDEPAGPPLAAEVGALLENAASRVAATGARVDRSAAPRRRRGEPPRLPAAPLRRDLRRLPAGADPRLRGGLRRRWRRTTPRCGRT